MKILHKVISADAIVVPGECYVVGAELNNCTDDGYLKLYNALTTTAAQLFATLRTSTTEQFDTIMFPMPGIKCSNVYADIDGTSAGTLFYYY